MRSLLTLALLLIASPTFAAEDDWYRAPFGVRLGEPLDDSMLFSRAEAFEAANEYSTPFWVLCFVSVPLPPTGAINRPRDDACTAYSGDGFFLTVSVESRTVVSVTFVDPRINEFSASALIDRSGVDDVQQVRNERRFVMEPGGIEVGIDLASERESGRLVFFSRSAWERAVAEGRAASD